jgi:GTPase
MQLENEFDMMNKNPEDNSDFDTDSEINPLDTLTVNGYTSSKKISSENPMKKKPIQISVMGRPNVGKSTFVNSVLKENWVIVNDLPGTTRDSVFVEWIHRGRRMKLIDNAGIRLASQAKSKIEEMVEEEVDKSLRYSHVGILVIDSMQAFMKQDMMVVQKVLEEGRALVIVANKWDLVEDKYKAKAVKWMQKQLERGLGQAKGIPLCYISAKEGVWVDKVMDEVLWVYEKWNTRVSSSFVNKWLTALKKIHKFPGENGRHIKIRFMMQINVRPPTFYMFVNDTRLVTETFRRFIWNTLVREFGFEGVPVRVLVRDSKAAYRQKKYDTLPWNTQKVLERIKLYQTKMQKPTFRRRISGAKFLYKK